MVLCSNNTRYFLPSNLGIVQASLAFGQRGRSSCLEILAHSFRFARNNQTAAARTLAELASTDRTGYSASLTDRNQLVLSHARPLQPIIPRCSSWLSNLFRRIRQRLQSTHSPVTRLVLVSSPQRRQIPGRAARAMRSLACI